MSQYTNPISPYLFDIKPIDLSGRGLRNPARFRITPGVLPDSGQNADVIRFVNGKAYIGNTPLGDINAQTGPATFDNGPAAAPSIVQATSEPARYGDSVIVLINFTGAGFSTNTTYSPSGSVVLPRPQNKRAALLINNQTVAGPIYYNYDQDADNVSGMQIIMGGSRNYAGETVPQGNLSIYSSGSGTVLIEYMNVSI